MSKLLRTQIRGYWLKLTYALEISKHQIGCQVSFGECKGQMHIHQANMFLILPRLTKLALANKLLHVFLVDFVLY